MATIPGRPFATIRRVLRARDVFGKPIQSDGVTVIPVASVIGGGGAGGGEGSRADSTPDEPTSAGAGLGFGFVARPVGAFVIKDGKARWLPAFNVTALTLGIVLAGLVVARWLLRGR